MLTGWALVLLWAVVALCLVPLAGFLLLPRLGTTVAFLAWAGMAAGAALLVRALFATDRSAK